MWSLAQASTNLYSTNSSGPSSTILILYLILGVAAIVTGWKLFEKAGQPGWKAIIPIYNMVITQRIAGMSGWTALLYFVPIVNIFFAIYTAYKTAQAFGYGVGMTLLELIYVGYLILAFGKAKYVGHYGPKA